MGSASAGSGRWSPSGCPWCRRSGCGWWRSPSACSTRRWWRTPSSTSTTTCGGRACPSPGGPAELADAGRRPGRPPARPDPAAVGVPRGRGPGGGSHRHRGQGPPRHHRRRVGRRGAGRLLRPLARPDAPGPVRWRPRPGPAAAARAAPGRRRRDGAVDAGDDGRRTPGGRRRRCPASSTSCGTPSAACPASSTPWPASVARTVQTARAVAARNRDVRGGPRPVAVPGAPDVDQPGHLAAPPGGLRRPVADRRPPGGRGRSGARPTTWSWPSPPGACGRFFAGRGEEPDTSLVALVPVSVRTEAEQGTLGNRVSGMLVSLATGVADPVARLAAHPRRHAGGQGAEPGGRARGLRVVGRGGVPGRGHPAVAAGDQPPPVRPRGAAVQPDRVQRARARTSPSTWPAPGWSRCTRSARSWRGSGST